jgi:hypothetical protein
MDPTAKPLEKNKDGTVITIEGTLQNDFGRATFTCPGIEISGQREAVLSSR